MFATRDVLLNRVSALEDSVRTGSNFCLAPRKNQHGRTSRKLNRNARSIDIRDQEVSYGVHGTDYLQIDVVTGKIRCGACAKELDATVQDASEEKEG